MNGIKVSSRVILADPYKSATETKTIWKIDTQTVPVDYWSDASEAYETQAQAQDAADRLAARITADEEAEDAWEAAQPSYTDFHGDGRYTDYQGGRGYDREEY